MGENEKVGAVMLTAMREMVGDDLVDMLQNFNDAGPQGVTLTQMLMGTLPRLYGKYSEMTPYIYQGIRAIASGQRSTSSIGGKLQQAILTEKVVQLQGIKEEVNQNKKGGGLAELINGGDKNKNTNSGIFGS